MSPRKPQSVLTALYSALKSAETTERDSAAVALAKQYAAQIDEMPYSAVKLGPLLLAVLIELKMTPKARTAVVRGGSGDSPRSALDELREKRDRRANGA